MRATLRDDDAPDGFAAIDARLPFLAIYAMQVLETAALARRIDIVRNGRPAVSDRLVEQLHDARVEGLGPGRRQSLGRRERVEAGAMQSFVDVDIPEPTQEGLVKQEGLQLSAARAQPGSERGGVDLERVRTERGRRGVDEAERTELPDVVKLQPAAVVEFQDGAGVSAGAGIHQERAGHAELDLHEAAVEFEQ